MNPARASGRGRVPVDWQEGPGSCAEADAGVHPCDEDIREEVHEDEQGGVEHRGGEDERVVAVEDSADEVLAEAWEVIDFLDDEGSGGDAGEGWSEEGGDWEEAVAERVAENDLPARDAFGAGGADIVLAEDFEHAAAGEPGNVGGVGKSHGGGREDPVGWLEPSGDIEEPPFEAEDGDEDGAHDKGGEADADHGEGHGAEVEPCVAADGGDDACGETDGEGDGESGRSDDERDREGIADDLGVPHALILHGESEIAAGVGREGLPVLDRERFVEAVLAFQFGADVRVHAFFRGEGIAGREAHHEERHGEDREEDGGTLEESAGDEAEHGERRAWQSGTGSGSCANGQNVRGVKSAGVREGVVGSPVERRCGMLHAGGHDDHPNSFFRGSGCCFRGVFRQCFCAECCACGGGQACGRWFPD